MDNGKPIEVVGEPSVTPLVATVHLTREEVRNLGMLIDVAVKAAGIQVIGPAAALFEKFGKAAAAVFVD